MALCEEIKEYALSDVMPFIVSRLVSTLCRAVCRDSTNSCTARQPTIGMVTGRHTLAYAIPAPNLTQ